MEDPVIAVVPRNSVAVVEVGGGAPTVLAAVGPPDAAEAVKARRCLVGTRRSRTVAAKGSLAALTSARLERYCTKSGSAASKSNVDRNLAR